MDDANTGYLEYKFPSITCSINCGDGWIEIIDDLFDAINALNPKGFGTNIIDQKFGCLRVLFRASVEEDFDRIKRLIWAAQNESVKTCEDCGNPGGLNRDGFIVALCGDCRDSRL